MSKCIRICRLHRVIYHYPKFRKKLFNKIYLMIQAYTNPYFVTHNFFQLLNTSFHSFSLTLLKYNNTKTSFVIIPKHLAFIVVAGFKSRPDVSNPPSHTSNKDFYKVIPRFQYLQIVFHFLSPFDEHMSLLFPKKNTPSTNKRTTTT